MVPDRTPGFAIHEVGIARMGSDPKKSVLNQFQQTHDVKNVFVCDGAGFASTACQNPTLTIMTLCVRSMDHLMGEMKRGNVRRREWSVRRIEASRSMAAAAGPNA